MKPHLKIKIESEIAVNGYVWIEYTCWTMDQLVNYVKDRNVLEIRIVKTN